MAEANVFDDRTTADLLELVRWLRAGRMASALPSGFAFTDTLPPPAYVHNDSGEEIPPYACMQVTDTEEIDGQNYLVVDKPADTDGTSGGYVFNGPFAIADDDEGKYQRGQVVRGYKNSGTITGGDKWSPVVNQWYISQVDGGPFIACGADDVDDDVLKVFSTGIGGDGVTLYRFTLNEAWSSNVADADILEMDGTDTGTDADVEDPLGIFSDLGSGDAGLCLLQGGKYYAIQAPCPT